MKKNKKEVRSWIPNGRESSIITQEAFNTVRTNLRFSKIDNGKAMVIGITSSFPTEGKSYCSINIAYSIARSGSKVLLIEGDLRKPTLAYKMKMRSSSKCGLSDLLCGLSDVNEAVAKKSLHENLDVMFSGNLPPNPQELLGSIRMRKLVEGLGTIYDYLVIDLPPIMSVSDTLSLSNVLDGIVLVVRENYSQKRLLKETIRQIQYADLKIFGFVYNDADIESDKYYGKYYGYYNYSQKK